MNACIYDNKNNIIILEGNYTECDDWMQNYLKQADAEYGRYWLVEV